MRPMHVGVQNLTSIVRNMNDKIGGFLYNILLCMFQCDAAFYTKGIVCKNRKKEVLLLPCWEGYHKTLKDVKLKTTVHSKELGEFSGKEQRYKELRLV